MKEDITKRIDDLNDELAIRQESINLLKGRLKNQITSFHKTIAKVLDKDTSLAEKIRTLFGEQGITIASMLMAIGVAIGVLVEALSGGEQGITIASMLMAIGVAIGVLVEALPGGGCCRGIRWRATS